MRCRCSARNPRLIGDSSATDRRFLSDPTVSTYVGDTPVFANFVLKDIKRVEAMRGPQGTLYGSGSLGGTVRFVMNEPSTEKFDARIDTSIGTTSSSPGQNFSADIMLNIPLSDELAFRFSSGIIDNDGVIDYANVYATDADGIPLAEGGDIAYGKPNSSEEEILNAARIAEASVFISELPEGMDTNIGEDGHKLSGGQRQRLAIARAVLKDAPILILDEATSNVDNETEAALQRSIEKISVDRTTLIIAHRLSTIRNADRIIVLDSGSISEEGTHDELIKNNGIYSRLWAVQTGEVEND